MWDAEVSAIQLWRKVPTQDKSFNVTTDAPHNQPHTWNVEEERVRSAYEGSSTKIDTASASDVGLNPLDDSAMEKPASSFLVIGGRPKLRGGYGDHFSTIPRTQCPAYLMITLLIE